MVLSASAITITITGPSTTVPTMITYEESLEIVLRMAKRLPPVTVPLHNVLGMVLPEDIRASDLLPPYTAPVK